MPRHEEQSECPNVAVTTSIRGKLCKSGLVGKKPPGRRIEPGHVSGSFSIATPFPHKVPRTADECKDLNLIDGPK